jgi:hypothetical protein
MLGNTNYSDHFQEIFEHQVTSSMPNVVQSFTTSLLSYLGSQILLVYGHNSLVAPFRSKLQQNGYNENVYRLL